MSTGLWWRSPDTRTCVQCGKPETMLGVRLDEHGACVEHERISEVYETVRLGSYPTWAQAKDAADELLHGWASVVTAVPVRASDGRSWTVKAGLR